MDVGASARHRLFSAGFSALDALRADRWLGPIGRGLGVVLAFHHVRPETPGGFRPNRALEITPDTLDVVLRLVRGLGFDLVPIAVLPERLRRGAPARPFCVLTFDDGYRDNLEHAWPILRRHGAPWTLYAVPEFVEGRGVLWWVALERAIAAAPRRLELTIGATRHVAPTGTDAEKAQAFARLAPLLRAAPRGEQVAAAGRLADGAALCRGLCANAAELRALAADPDVAIGAHTLGHPVLAQLTDAQARAEIVDGRARLESLLDRPVRHLAYPHGDRDAIGPREIALAREAGFATAVTTRPDHLRIADLLSLTALPRVTVNGLHQSPAALRLLLSGAPFAASALRRTPRLAVRAGRL